MDDFAGVATCEERELLGAKFDLLKAAALIPHNKSSLLAHLIGVWRVLRAGGAESDVADAGLIHSVYATQFFNFALFDDRQRRQLSVTFGDKSEALAWLFCQINREELARQRPSKGYSEAIFVRQYKSDTAIILAPDIANSLFMLECANFIDQGYQDREIGSFHAWALGLSERGVDLNFKHPLPDQSLDESAEEAAISLYSEVAGGRDDLTSLQRAAELDPLSAEPLILLAAAAAAEGRYDDAERDLVAASERLPLFGTSWDKRLTWAQWLAISRALERSIRLRLFPDFGGYMYDPGALLRWSMPTS